MPAVPDDLLAKLIELEVDGEALTVDDIRSFVARISRLGAS